MAGDGKSAADELSRLHTELQVKSEENRQIQNRIEDLKAATGRHEASASKERTENIKVISQLKEELQIAV